MGDQRQEILLLLDHFRFSAQRATDDSDAGRKSAEKECTLPRVLIDALTLFRQQRPLDLRGDRCGCASDQDARQQLVNVLRRGSRIEQRLGSTHLLTVQRLRELHLLDRLGSQVEQPPADRDGGNHHQGQCRELKDACGFESHDSSAGAVSGNLGERLPQCLREALDVRRLMSQRQEAALVRRRREIHASREQFVEQRGKSGGRLLRERHGIARSLARVDRKPEQ